MIWWGGGKSACMQIRYSSKSECLPVVRVLVAYFGIVWVVFECFIAVENGHVKFLGGFEGGVN